MRKSDRPPNYLIDKIVRHTNIIITAPYGSVKYMDAGISGGKYSGMKRYGVRMT